MDKQQLYDALNQGMIAERLPAFQRNCRQNLPIIKKYGGLAPIVPKGKDRDIIIAGAGPSLAACREALRRYQHRQELLIIATDMALRPLIAWGIRPALVISCETTPQGFFNGIDTADMRLLAFSCMSNNTLRSWKGAISFFNWMIYGAPFDELWEMAGVDLGFVGTGNIVTTQAVAFALGCQARSVLLVGNDLGFRDQFYCNDTVRSVSAHMRADRLGGVDTIARDSAWRAREYSLCRGERSTFTNRQFLAAKYWLEDLCANQRTPVYDASEPGCSETGVRKINIEDYFSQYNTRKIRRR